MKLINVHDPAACQGEPCCIHDPSNHPLKDKPMNWRADRQLMERVCDHGIGHPDPDHIKHVTRIARYASVPVDVDGIGVHGCDGCCQGGEQ